MNHKFKLSLYASFVLAGLLIAILVSVLKNNNVKLSDTKQDNSQFVRQCSRRWLKQKASGPSFEEVTKVVGILKKYEFTQDEIQDLLGEPERKSGEASGHGGSWVYTLSDSSALVVKFGDSGLVNDVQAPGVDEANTTLFKEQWYFQVIGKTASDVEKLIGEPVSTKDQGARHLHSVGSEVFELVYDANGKVIAIEKSDTESK